ncbi:MAG: CRISPR-associated endoribonuclease Cas6 [Caldithrix sp.]|nr:CRISPR-associated endoribonuclease Cas6 [Caldithrix sp.]
MRIQLKFKALTVPFILSYNYQPHVQAFIYKAIAHAEQKYAAKLHDLGYWHPRDGKRYKLFVFSDLLLGKRQPVKDGLKVYNAHITLLISSAMPLFLEALVNGVFHSHHITLGKNHFIMDQFETLPEPAFRSEMQFTCLSPLTLSTQIQENGRLKLHYIRPQETRSFERVMHENLANKYRRIHGKEPPDGPFRFDFDKRYIDRKKGRISRLTYIHKDTPQETAIKGFMAPFTVQAHPDLIKVGYEAGFGGRNSLGFGMVDIVRGKIDHETHE